jgi:hypothetical protein
VLLQSWQRRSFSLPRVDRSLFRYALQLQRLKDTSNLTFTLRCILRSGHEFAGDIAFFDISVAGLGIEVIALFAASKNMPNACSACSIAFFARSRNSLSICDHSLFFMNRS